MKRYEDVESILSKFNQTNYKVAGCVALYCFGVVDKISSSEKLTLVTDNLEAFRNRITASYDVYSSDVDRVDISIEQHVIRVIEDKEFMSRKAQIRILPVSSCREVPVLTVNELLRLYVGRVTGNTSTPDDVRMLESLTKLNIL